MSSCCPPRSVCAAATAPASQLRTGAARALHCSRGGSGLLGAWTRKGAEWEAGSRCHGAVGVGGGGVGMDCDCPLLHCHPLATSPTAITTARSPAASRRRAQELLRSQQWRRASSEQSTPCPTSERHPALPALPSCCAVHPPSPSGTTSPRLLSSPPYSLPSAPCSSAVAMSSQLASAVGCQAQGGAVLFSPRSRILPSPLSLAVHPKLASRLSPFSRKSG